MKDSRDRIDARDLTSLAIALLSAVMVVVYWVFFAGQSNITYNVFADVMYRFLAVPIAVVSVSFFLSSHFIVKVRTPGKTLFVAKIICLLLSIAYVACVISMLGLGRLISQETAVAMMLFVQTFESYAPCFVGLILGIRTDVTKERRNIS